EVEVSRADADMESNPLVQKRRFLAEDRADCELMLNALRREWFKGAQERSHRRPQNLPGRGAKPRDKTILGHGSLRP
ncbi:MAG TPA: hypothetical protein VG095_01810, partial [Chthoniobacterales bacterium]|nr:hypothetical protein [Chthoniobacterales bacterium]